MCVGNVGYSSVVNRNVGAIGPPRPTCRLAPTRVLSTSARAHAGPHLRVLVSVGNNGLNNRKLISTLKALVVRLERNSPSILLNSCVEGTLCSTGVRL